MPPQQRLHFGMVDATEVKDIGLGQREKLQGLDAQSLRGSGLGLQLRAPCGLQGTPEGSI